MKYANIYKLPNQIGGGYTYSVEIRENGQEYKWFTEIKTFEEANTLVEKMPNCVLKRIYR